MAAYMLHAPHSAGQTSSVPDTCPPLSVSCPQSRPPAPGRKSDCACGSLRGPTRVRPLARAILPRRGSAEMIKYVKGLFTLRGSIKWRKAARDGNFSSTAREKKR